MRTLVCLTVIVCAAPVQATAKPLPVILDTDIGTDVDDAYALVVAARSPRLDLRAVSTLYGKVDVRSAIARKLLLQLGKDKVPVASGPARPLDGRTPFWGGWEGKGVLDPDEKVGGISKTPAPELIPQLLQASNDKVVIISVGGLTNVALALQKTPAIKDKIARLVVMGGCVRPLVIEGKKLPERLETNLHNDPEAAAFVLKSGVPITLVPAEVTFQTKLLKSDFVRIQEAATPLAKSMVRMTEIWEPGMKGFMKALGVQKYYYDGTVMLHDPLAVMTLAEPSMVKTERQRIRIEVEKRTIRTIADPQGPITIDLVTTADLPRLSSTVTDLVVEKQNREQH